MTCYALEFSNGRIYVGYTESLDTVGQRLSYHKRGKGSAFCREMFKRGNTIERVVVFPNGTRDNERAIKNRKNHAKFLANCTIDKNNYCYDVLPIPTKRYSDYWRYMQVLTLLVVSI